jgi:mannose-6-phosphate isomerase-like protein (cupin superfamily)
VEFEFMRTTLSPGVNAGAFLPHNPGSREYVAIERGMLRLTLDGEVYLLKKGDSIYYAGDCIHEFENPDTRNSCEYYLAMDVTGHPEQLRHRIATNGRTPGVRTNGGSGRPGQSRTSSRKTPNTPRH